jgi:D-amino-acid dehydrogenase
MGRNPSVAIIGGGVVGLSTAYYAMEKGCQVAVLERGGPDHDCCSLGNAGMIVPSHFVPLAAPGMVGLGLRMMFNPEGPFAIRPRADAEFLRWAWRFCRAANARHVQRAAPLLYQLETASRRCYDELAERLDDFGLTRSGLFMLCKTDHGLHEQKELAKMARSLGMQPEVLSPEEVAQRETNLRVDVAGAVYYPEDWYLDPRRLLPSLARTLEAGGTRLAWNAEVTGWRVAGDRIQAAVSTNSDFSADEYVVAGGSWSPGILRSLGVRLPVQAGRGLSVTLPSPKRRPAIPAIMSEARVAMTPMGSSLRIAGTMEFAGLDLSVNPRRVRGILRAIPRYYPDFTEEDFAGVPVWSGLRPCSPDGLPFIGRTARFANLSLATGHAMLGVTMGPVTGRLISEILAGERPSIDVAPLSPDRYP